MAAPHRAAFFVFGDRTENGWQDVLPLSASMMFATALVPGALRATGPLKVAGVYTVPVEQQWVSRIQQAAQAADRLPMTRARARPR